MEPNASIWTSCLEHAALTDVGLRRVNNQDAYTVALAGNQADFDQRGHLFMVADGMGAHAAGELASKMAADVVSLVYRKRIDLPPPEALVSAVHDANHQIHSRGQASPDFRGMGTTCSVLVILPAGALVAHVGDSRAYRVRGNRIEQLTFDHSLVWEIRAAGQKTEAELPNYISKNIITRSLGPNSAVQVDVEGPFPLQAGDTFLLCSDGLSGQVKDDEIGLVLGCLPLAEAVQTLIDLANLRGGPDNITVVTAKILGPQVAESMSSESLTTPAENKPAPVHPAVWTVMGVSGLAAAAMLTLGYPLIALLGLAGVVISGIVAMMQRSGGSGRTSEMKRGRYGRGPYVAADWTPTPELMARITDILNQLRDATKKENWAIDWASYEQIASQAASFTQSNDLISAARAHLRAISFLMAQLRKLRAAKTGK